MRHPISRLFYRILLRLGPFHLRRSHGKEMERLFAETLDLEQGRLSWLGYPVAWFAAVRDMLTHAARERLWRRSGPGRAGPAGDRHRYRNPTRTAVAQPLSILRLDLRYAVRGLWRNRGFTAVAVVTLAVGIGVNTAIFSVVNSVVFVPLAYDAPDRLVRIYGTLSSQNRTTGHVSAPDVRDWDAQSTTLDAVAAIDWGSGDLSGNGDPVVVRVANVSGNFFALLGARPSMGRLLLPDDDLAGNDRVAVITDGLWRRRFGNDPDVLGRSITLDAVERVVIGVLAADFEEPSAAGPGEMAEVWVPVGTTGIGANRGVHWLQALGRLADGATLQQAETELNAIVTSLAAEYPNTNPADAGARVVSLHESIWGNATAPLLALLGAAGFVFLIACGNIASLILARGTSRAREIALRNALGAGRAQIIRLLFFEGLVLSVVAGAAGLITAAGLGPWLGVAAQGRVSRIADVTIDLRVLAFAAVVSLGGAIVFGLLPAFRISRSDPQDALKEGGKGLSPGKRGRLVRSYLVTGQMAMSLVLLIGAGLMVRSFAKILKVETGYDRQDVVTFQLSLPGNRYRDFTRVTAFQERLLQGIAALPGVEHVGAVDKLPLGTRWGCGPLAVGDRPIPVGADWPCADSRAATPDYFAAMGIALLRGRSFTSADLTGSPPVVVVNETMARQFWPGEDPLGKRVKWNSDVSNNFPWRTVVGLVEDVKHRGLDMAAEPEVYTPLTQTPDRRTSFVVRATTDPSQLMNMVRATVFSLDPNLPIRQASTIGESISESVAEPRLAAVLIAALAAVALLLSLVGNYGVLAYFVSQRSHEVGVRMALGANRSDVVLLVVLQGMRMAGVGLAIGLVVSIGLTRVIEGFLFEVSPLDVRTFAATSMVLIATAALASYLPARRATRVDPISALRAE